MVPADAAAWARMRSALWPEEQPGEHATEIAAYFAGEFLRGPWCALLAEGSAGEAIGFAEVSIRSYAEGCVTPRVAYLEGWFVEAAHRRSGVGAALLRAAEEWGRAQGCTEFASDADPENAISIDAHLALGFEDAGMVRCFRKSLGD